MKTYREILKEQKGPSFLHIINDKTDDKEWKVMHSIHPEPQLGGQVLKSFNDGKKAQTFAIKMSIPHKDILIIWKQTGSGANVKFERMKSISK